MRVPLMALTNGCFGYGQSNRRILVLKAFFDDSGTHAGADAIIMGGLIGHQDSWAAIEPQWAAALDDLEISAMHMAHCEKRRKEFKDWEYDARQAAIRRFREILVGQGDLLMVMSALSRRAWDEAVARAPILATAHPEPIGFCFVDCMQRSSRYGRKSAGYSEPVVVTFDSREQSLPLWSKRAAGFERLYPQKIAGFAFSDMRKVLPLQAADMVAYEGFRFQCERERQGCEPEPRENFRRLVEELQLNGGFYTADSLVQYAERLEAGARRR